MALQFPLSNVGEVPGARIRVISAPDRYRLPPSLVVTVVERSLTVGLVAAPDPYRTLGTSGFSHIRLHVVVHRALAIALSMIHWPGAVSIDEVFVLGNSVCPLVEAARDDGLNEFQGQTASY